MEVTSADREGQDRHVPLSPDFKNRKPELKKRRMHTKFFLINQS
jgi:hypothetical protein